MPVRVARLWPTGASDCSEIPLKVMFEECAPTFPREPWGTPVGVSSREVDSSETSAESSMSTSASRMGGRGKIVCGALWFPLVGSGAGCSGGGMRHVKENFGLPTSQEKSQAGSGFETYMPTPPRARTGSTALEPAGSPTSGLWRNSAFFMRFRKPLVVVVFFGFPRGSALKALPSFNFRFLSERSSGSSEGGAESLVRAELFSQKIHRRRELTMCFVLPLATSRDVWTRQFLRRAFHK